jgi:hypothetical protein
LYKDSKEKVIAVWKSFETSYSILNSWSPSKLEVDSFFELARKWVLDFRSLREHLEGYDSNSITPYIHVILTQFFVFVFFPMLFL